MAIEQKVVETVLIGVDISKHDQYRNLIEKAYQLDKREIDTGNRERQLVAYPIHFGFIANVYKEQFPDIAADYARELGELTSLERATEQGLVRTIPQYTGFMLGLKDARIMGEARKDQYEATIEGFEKALNGAVQHIKTGMILPSSFVLSALLHSTEYKLPNLQEMSGFGIKKSYY